MSKGATLHINVLHVYIRFSIIKSPIFHLRPINEVRLTIKQSTCNWLLAGLHVHFHVQRQF